MRRQGLWRAVALVCVLAFVSCAAATTSTGVKRSAPGQVAVEGLKVADTLDQIQRAGVTLQQNDPQHFTAEAAIQFQTKVKQAADKGTDLTTVLKKIQTVIDAGKVVDPNDSSSAQQKITEISNLLIEATGYISGSAQANQIRDLIKAVVQTGNTILLNIGKGQ